MNKSTDNGHTNILSSSASHSIQTYYTIIHSTSASNTGIPFYINTYIVGIQYSDYYKNHKNCPQPSSSSPSPSYDIIFKHETNNSKDPNAIRVYLSFITQ